MQLLSLRLFAILPLAFAYLPKSVIGAGAVQRLAARSVMIGAEGSGKVYARAPAPEPKKGKKKKGKKGKKGGDDGGGDAGGGEEAPAE